MFYNLHVHTFRDLDVPDHYLPLNLAKLAKTKLGSSILRSSLRNLLPFTHRDMFDRYAKFISTGKLSSQEEIFASCAKFYPDDTRFGVLAIDMEFMGAGRVNRPYREQLEELGALASKDQRVLPFMMVDPRRPKGMDLFQEMLDKYPFQGIKLYPTMGYFPYEQKLDPYYQLCQDRGLSVIAHCSPYNPTYFKGSRKELLRMLEASNEPIETKGKKGQELCTYFTQPQNYHTVLERFPNLNICLAHFGSSYYWSKYLDHPDAPDNWFTTIRNMIQDYPNLYTDISFTLNKENYFSLLKVILADAKVREKILFGSDYYMVQTRSTERRFGIDLRAFIGEENFEQIARINPERFLNLAAQ